MTHARIESETNLKFTQCTFQYSYGPLKCLLLDHPADIFSGS